MFGSYPAGLNMPSTEFAKDFLSAFDAQVITCDMSGHQSVSSYYVPSLYTISIQCQMISLPLDKVLRDHFELSEPGHSNLVKMNYVTIDDGVVRYLVELTYKSLDVEKFLSAVKNISYKRFSDKFNEQLDSCLDKET
jgi:hypothetical protein